MLKVEELLHIIGKVIQSLGFCPIQVAKYAVDQGIQNEPAFNWSDHHILKKRDRTIFSVKRCSA